MPSRSLSLALLLVAATARAQAPGEAAPPPPPAPQQPVYQQPVYQQPVYQQPVYQQPVYYQQPPATPMRTVYQPRWGLFGAGTAIFFASYLLNVGFSYGFDDRAAHLSLIPVIGPFFQINDLWQRGSSAGTLLVATYGTVGLIWDFIGQAAGMTMSILGISLWRRTQVYAGSGPTRLALTPGPAGAGAGFALTF